MEETTQQEQVNTIEQISQEDVSTIDRTALLAEIECIQKEIKERQDVVLSKAKLLEKAIEYVGTQKVNELKDKDYKTFTDEEWSWLLSEGTLDDRSGAKHNFKREILFGKFGFMVDQYWKFSSQSCLTVGKVFFKVPGYSAGDRIKDISKHYKTLNSFHDQENVHIFKIQDKRNYEAGIYYLEFNHSNNTARISKVYHNATTTPKEWAPLEETLKHVEKIAA